MTTEKLLNWLSENWFVATLIIGAIVGGIVKIIKASQGKEVDEDQD